MKSRLENNVANEHNTRLSLLEQYIVALCWVKAFYEETVYAFYFIYGFLWMDLVRTCKNKHFQTTLSDFVGLVK